MAKTASAMSVMGNTFEESVALMVGAGEQMPNQAGKISRGLRSISLEINKYAQSNKYLETSAGNIDLFDEQTGAMKSTFDILSDLYKLYPKISDEEKTSIGLALAGKTQFEVFSATMSGFNQVLNAHSTALLSTGSAMRENEKYLSGLEASVAKLSATWENTINDLISEETIGGLLDLATSILKISGNMDVLAPAVVVATGAMIAFNTQGAINTVSNVAKAGKAILTLATNMKSLATGATLSSTATVGAIGGIIAVIGLAVTAYQAYQKAQEEARKEAVELTNQYSEQAKGLSTLETSWNAIIDLAEKDVDVTEQLASFKSTLVEVYGFEKEAVDNLNLSRQEGIDLLKKESELSIDKNIASLADEYAKADKMISSYSTTAVGYDISGIGNDAEKYGLTSGAFAPLAEGGIIEQYNAISNAIKQVEEEYDSLGDSTEDALKKDELVNFSNALDEALSGLQDDYDYVQNLNGLLAQQALIMKPLGDATSVTADNFDEWKQSQLDGYTVTQDVKNLMSDLIDQTYPELSGWTQQLTTDITVATDANEDYEESVEDLGNQFDDFSNKVSSASNMISDFEKYGGLTEGTIDSLTNSFPDLVGQLVNADGSISDFGLACLNTADDAYTLIKAIYEMNLELAQMELSEARSTGIMARGFLEPYYDALEKAETELDAFNQKYGTVVEYGNKGSSTGGTTDKPDPLAEQSEKYKAKIDYLEFQKESAEREAKDEEELREISLEHNAKILKELQDQEDWFREQGLDDNSEYIQDLIQQQWDYADEIKSINQDIEDARVEAQKEALQSNIDDLEKQKSDMETAFSYLETIVNKQIEAVQDEMDAIEEAYQAKIDALNAENDAIEKQISLEEKLEALASAKEIEQLVYRDGKFQYVSDYDAISSAQSDLDDYNREQTLADQIAELESNRDDELETLQGKIDGWQEYLDSYSGIVDDYGLEQDRLIAEQVLGTQLEQENWDIRLSNAEAFANKYNSIMSSIGATSSALSTLGTDTSSTTTSGTDAYNFNNKPSGSIDGFISASDLASGNFTVIDPDTGNSYDVGSGSSPSTSSYETVSNSSVQYSIGNISMNVDSSDTATSVIKGISTLAKASV